MVHRDVQRIRAVIENRKFIEQSGTQEHEMYIDFDALNFTLYTGEGICGFLSDESKVILGIESNAFPVYLGGGSDADEQYLAYHDEGLNMYDTGEYGQARWSYLEHVLKVLTLYLNK